MTENEEETVSPEQTDLIVQYSSISGHDDLDQCANHLKAHNWDLAAAINTNMATAELDASTSNHSMPPTSSSSAGSLGSLFGPAEAGLAPPPPAEGGVRRRFGAQPPPAVQGQV